MRAEITMRFHHRFAATAWLPPRRAMDIRIVPHAQAYRHFIKTGVVLAP
jgi:hypothetical protein